MKILRVYLDTSVLGGCFDPPFEQWSNGLLADFAAGRFLPVVSEELAAEVANAPPRVQEVLDRIRDMNHVYVERTPEAAALRVAYAAHRILSPKYESDLVHVSLATVSACDVLASWNFKHIVRFDKIRLFNAVNLELGYPQIAIHSPRELTSYGREQD